jgi:hypothetical protein
VNFIFGCHISAFQGVTAIHFSNTNGTRSGRTGTRSTTTFPTRTERVPLVAGKYAKFLSDQKLSTKPAHLHLSFGTFISNLCSVHFPFVAIILHLWIMKFSMPEKWTYLTR